VEQPAAVQTSLPASRANARAMSGWLRFIGIVTLISGVLQALSIVGIIWAWLSIWLGVLLNQASAGARGYADRGDEPPLDALTAKLKTCFTLIGIVTIVAIAVSLIAGAVWLVIFATGGMGLLLERLRELGG